MKRFSSTSTAGQIALLLKGELKGDPSVQLSSVASPENADETSICFLENPTFLEAAKASRAGLLLVSPKLYEEGFENRNSLIVERPMMAFMMLVSGMLEAESRSKKRHVSRASDIAESATIGKNVDIAPGVVIGENSIVGNDCIIGANCVIGDRVKIGKGCKLFANVTVYDDCVLQDRVILHSGVVIGADGFGYALIEGRQAKIPQIGDVIIEDDVEIGANSCVDRATLGSTIIGARTKLDNLVQVGHNVVIATDTILCSQVGIAGSTEIGSRCYLAGQVGVADHTKIGDEVLVAAQSGLAKDAPDGAKLFGTPALDATQQKRVLLSLMKLPEFMKETRKFLKKKKNEE